MKNMLHKTTLREIKQTFGRFFAIFAIIALGVGFFSGVRITTPAMVHTVDTYLQESQFFDYRLISTLGWEDQDLDRFAGQDDVRYIEGAYSIDALFMTEDKTELTIKVHSIPENISKISVVEGRLPENDKECVVDSVMGNAPEVGEKIYVEDSNEEDTLDMLKYREFTVVGLVDSSNYINFERGTTSIGTGSLDGFIYISPKAFDSEVYTEIYVRFDQDYEIYSDEYKDYMKAKKKTWEQLTDDVAEERYDRLIKDAEEEIADGEKELEDKRAEGEEELEDARKELADGKKELDDAETELNDAKDEIASSKKKLDDAWQELVKGRADLDKAKQDLADGRKELDKTQKKIASGEKALKNGQAKIDAANQKLLTSEAELDKQDAALKENEIAFQAQMESVGPNFDFLPEDQKATILATKTQLETARAAITQGRAQIEAGKKEIAKNQKKLNKEKKTFQQGKKKYLKGEADSKKGLADYNKGEADYAKGLAEYNNGKKKLVDGEKEYEDGLKEYEDGLAEYEDGKKEYEDGKKEFDEKIKDAEEEIADAKQELADVEKPDTFLLDRNTNIGYACFESDSEIVAQVAKVLPLFFILVAALVCVTTMGRMVEEQRTGIGVLKALGYSEGAIMGKYMFYSGSASILGCIIGYSFGIIGIPAVIWNTYRLMYHALPMKYIFDWKLATASLLAAVLCSLGTTYIACRVELQETAASLMRPKAPKAGQRIFLEYIPALWNHLNFLLKVSIRNIFRYKGRFFMMVVGISGCTALLLTGFGIKDSVGDFSEVQYEEIQITDALITYKNGEGTKLPGELGDRLSEGADTYLLLHQAAWDLVTEEKVKEVSLIVPETWDDIEKYMKFNDLEGNKLTCPKKDEIYICNSLSERYNVALGDEIILRDSDMREMHVKVTGIFENHVYNYVFLSQETMESQLKETLDYNGAYINYKKGADEYKETARIARDENVTSSVLFEELKVRMANMMSRLNYIILVIIVFAAGLAFVVLYNLTNINITERLREIATIKVLGFFRRETSTYVFRENLVLTGIGILAGLGLGKLLHKYVMMQIVVDMVSFKSRILPDSYLYSIILTFAFTIVVNALMGIKLEKINMAESLKSVE